MLNVFLTTAYKNNKAPAWLKEHAVERKYNITDDPESADLIIFVEAHPDHDPYFFQVYQNPVFKKYKHKSVLYHDADLSITFIKTISPSIESWQYNPDFNRSVHYIARLCENDAIAQHKVLNDQGPRKYLYSFIGSDNHSSRKKIFSLNHQKNTFILDTSGQKAWELTSDEKKKYEEIYLDTLINSDFVLCPRGFGPSTYRLFEVMQMGRCPVIISDQWIRPDHIDWDSFAIFIDEKDISKIPEILEKKKKAAKEMGALAKSIWDAHFSPEASFNFLIQNACSLINNQKQNVINRKAIFQFIQSTFHFRNILRFRMRTFLK